MTSNAVSIGRAQIANVGRNRLINGSCIVVQRASTTYTTGIGGYGGPDRWITANSGAGGSFTQSGGTMYYKGVAYPCIIQSVTTAPTTLTTTSYWYGFDHRIEGYNCFDLLGETVTVSFIFESNVTGTYCVCLRDSGSIHSYVTTFTVSAVNTPQYYSFTIPIPTNLVVGLNTSTGLELTVGFLNQGTYVTSTPNTWITGNALTVASAVNWGATAGNYIAMTNVQLESGAVATPFERRNYSIEYLLCQRYYQQQQLTCMVGLCYTSNGDTRVDIPFKQQMRAIPTITFNSTTLNVIATGNTATATNVTITIAANAITLDSYNIQTTSTTNITSTGSICFWGSNAPTTVYISAEL